MIVIFGPGTRLHYVHVYNNRKWCPSQRTAAGSAVSSFIDGIFEGVEMLSGRRALRCDKPQFHAKMTVSSQPFSRYHW